MNIIQSKLPRLLCVSAIIAFYGCSNAAKTSTDVVAEETRRDTILTASTAKDSSTGAVSVTTSETKTETKSVVPTEGVTAGSTTIASKPTVLDTKKAAVNTTPAPPQVTTTTTKTVEEKPVAPAPAPVKPVVVNTAKEAPPVVNPPAPAPSQEKWTAPAKAKNVVNPIAVNGESLGTGKSLYQKHCSSCHGKSGAGDGSKAAQLKTELTSFKLSSFQSQSDGSMFYKINEGREDMPSFKKKIPDTDEVWSIVNYLRTLK
jgi:mono/diheme cytochrome c family protein